MEISRYHHHHQYITLPGHESLGLLVHTEAVTEEDGAGLHPGFREEEGEEGDDEGRPGGVVVREVWVQD